MEKPNLSGAARRLTDREQAVMQRIDRRVPIKVIALELGVSETRINQHIRALKDIYEAGSLGELLENYRATLPPAPAENAEDEHPVTALLGEPTDRGASGAFSEAAYTKKQIPEAAIFADQLSRDDPGRLLMSDAMPLLDQGRPGSGRASRGLSPECSMASMPFCSAWGRSSGSHRGFWPPWC
jgi:DNA-binding CsgD family transcriptional regulator